MAKIDDEDETTPTSKECARDEMIDTSEEEPTMPHATKMSKVGSNDMNMTPLEIGSM
jgi:hypothetical protein